MKNRSLRTTIALFICVIALYGCQKKAEPEMKDTTASSASAMPSEVKQGDGKGVVKQLNAAGRSITLDHNDIPGVMDAMAMPYKVDSASVIAGLAIGDSVSFTLQDRGEGNYVVTSIHTIAKK